LLRGLRSNNQNISNTMCHSSPRSIGHNRSSLCDIASVRISSFAGSYPCNPVNSLHCSQFSVVSSLRKQEWAQVLQHFLMVCSVHGIPQRRCVSFLLIGGFSLCCLASLRRSFLLLLTIGSCYCCT
jgi:hypothetical protein